MKKRTPQMCRADDDLARRDRILLIDYLAQLQIEKLTLEREIKRLDWQLRAERKQNEVLKARKAKV